MPPAHTSRLPKTSNTAMAMYLLLAVALVTPALSAPKPGLREYPEYRCPEGWMLVDQSCFFLADVSGNWTAGQIFCNAEGAALATISSELQQETLSSNLTESVWIGLNDLKEETIFAWADGSESTFTSWAADEPNNHWFSGDEDCVEMRKVKGFLWNDESCKLIRQFLCSTPAEVITTTTTTTTTTTPAPVCEEGWDMFELSCYQVNNDEATWDEASKACENQGAHLVSITSEGEQGFLKAMVQQSTWIGLKEDEDVDGEDVEGERNFAWVDSCEVSYTNWSEDEPNDDRFGFSFFEGEKCVEMRTEYAYLWNDESCSTDNAFICEKPPQ